MFQNAPRARVAPTVCQDAIPPAFENTFLVNWRNKLGQGAFARVYECVEVATGTAYAVKIIDCSRWRLLKSFSMHRVLREATILKSLDHSNIVRMRAVFYTANALWLVQDLVPGSELFQVVVRGGPMPEVRKPPSQLNGFSRAQ